MHLTLFLIWRQLRLKCGGTIALELLMPYLLGNNKITLISEAKLNLQTTYF